MESLMSTVRNGTERNNRKNRKKKHCWQLYDHKKNKKYVLWNMVSAP